MNPFVHEFYVNLRTGAAIERGRRDLSQGDAYADKIVVHVQDCGQDVNLSGMGVSAKVIRFDGQTVPLTGRVENGAACVTLDASCYTVPGEIRVTVSLSVGQMIQSVLKLLLNVDTSETSVIVDNDTIGNLTELLAEIANMRQATAAANAAAVTANEAVGKIAAVFDENTAYSAGDIVIYEGEVYRFYVDHPAGVWIGSDAEKRVIGDAVSDAAKAAAVADANAISDGVATVVLRWLPGRISSGGVVPSGPQSVRYAYYDERLFDITEMPVGNTVNVPDGYQLGVYYYDSNGAFLEYAYKTGAVKIASNRRYVRFCLMAVSDNPSYPENFDITSELRSMSLQVRKPVEGNAYIEKRVGMMSTGENCRIPLQLMRGYWSMTTGAEATSDAYIMTSYRDDTYYETMHIASVSVPAGYSVSVYYYDSGYNFTTATEKSSEFTVLKSYPYVRFAIRNSGKTAFEVTDELREAFAVVTKYKIRTEEQVAEIAQQYDLTEEQVAEIAQRYDLTEARVAEIAKQYDLTEARVAEIAQQYDLTEERVAEIAQQHALAEEQVETIVSSKVAQAKAAIDAQVENLQFSQTGFSQYDKNHSVGNGASTTPGLVTFVTDDARVEDYTVFKPIFDKYGVGCTTAVAAGRVGNVNGVHFDTIEQLKELEAAGWEICSHAYHSNLTTLSDDELDEELAGSQNWLLENGFGGWDILMYPFGGYDERVKRFTAKYYKMARTTQDGVGRIPLNTYEVAGSYFDNRTSVSPGTGYARNTIEHWAALIDSAMANGYWLIIWTHSWEVAQWGNADLFDQVVKYASENATVVSCKRAMELIGNTVDQTSWVRQYDEHFVVSNNGIVDSNVARTVVLEPNSVSFSTPPFDFRKEFISICRMSNAANKAEAPGGLAGTLITYNFVPDTSEPSNSAYCWQEYHPYGTAYALMRTGNYANRWYSNWRYTNNLVISTANRTAETFHKYVGLIVYDSTLNKPVYYNGTSWLDMAGTAVD